MPLSKDILNAGLQGLMNDPDLLASFFKLYQDTFKVEPCTTCPGKIAGYFEQLKISDMKKTEEEQFILKPESLIPWKVDDGAYMDVTQANVNSPLKAKNGKEYPIGAHLFAINSGYGKFFQSTPPTLFQMIAEIKGNIPPPAKIIVPNVEESFMDKLVAISGIGPKTAVKIIEDFPNEAELVKAIAAKEALPYKEGVNDSLKEVFST